MLRAAVVFTCLVTAISSAYAQTNYYQGKTVATTATGSTTSRTLADRAADVINVLDYGASPGASAAVNLTAFQAAAAAACSTAGPAAEIYIPQGQYSLALTSPVTINCTGVSVRGGGNQATALLLPSGVAGTLFKWTQPTGQAAGGYASISNLRIFQSGNPSSGSCLLLDHVTSVKVKDVAIDGCFEDVTVVASGDIVIDTLISTGVNTNAGSANVHYYRNVLALTTSASTASGTALPFASTSGVYVGQTVTGSNIPAATTVASFTGVAVTLSQAISGTVGSGATITFTDSNPANNFLVNSDLWPSAVGGVGNNIVVGDTDGLALNNNHMGRAIGDNLLIKPSTVTSRIVGIGCVGGQRPTFDSPGGFGVHFSVLGGYTGTNGVHHFIGCGVNAAGSDGYRFDDLAVFNVTLSATGLQNNAGNGINVQAGHDFAFTGGDAYNNNTGNTSASDILVGGTSRNVHIGGFAFNSSTPSVHPVSHHVTIADSADYVTIGPSVYHSTASSGRDINNTSTADPSHFYFAPGSTDQTTPSWTAIAANPNILINGAMLFDQANEGVAVALTSAASSAQTIDGWIASYTSPASGVTVGRVVDGPGTWPDSMKVTVGTGTGSVGVTDGLRVSQRIQAGKLSAGALGTAAAGRLCMQLQAKSSIASYTFSVALRNFALNRNYIHNLTVTSANTWTPLSFCFPGDIGGTWVTNGTAGGAVLTVSLAEGSSNLDTADAWGTTGDTGASGITNTMLTTTGATFEISDAKLEFTNSPSLFTFDYDAGLREVERFYEKSYDQGTALGTVTGQGVGGLYAYGGGNGNNGGGTIFFKTPKNCHPAMTAYSPTTGASGKAHDFTGSAEVNATFLTASNESVLMFATTGSGSISLQAQWTADCRL